MEQLRKQRAVGLAPDSSPGPLDGQSRHALSPDHRGLGYTREAGYPRSPGSNCSGPPANPESGLARTGSRSADCFATARARLLHAVGRKRGERLRPSLAASLAHDEDGTTPCHGPPALPQQWRGEYPSKEGSTAALPRRPRENDVKPAAAIAQLRSSTCPRPVVTARRKRRSARAPHPPPANSGSWVEGSGVGSGGESSSSRPGRGGAQRGLQDAEGEQSTL